MMMIKPMSHYQSMFTFRYQQFLHLLYHLENHYHPFLLGIRELSVFHYQLSLDLSDHFLHYHLNLREFRFRHYRLDLREFRFRHYRLDLREILSCHYPL